MQYKSIHRRYTVNQLAALLDELAAWYIEMDSFVPSVEGAIDRLHHTYFETVEGEADAIDKADARLEGTLATLSVSQHTEDHYVPQLLELGWIEQE